MNVKTTPIFLVNIRYIHKVLLSYSDTRVIFAFIYMCLEQGLIGWKDECKRDHSQKERAIQKKKNFQNERDLL